MTLINGLHRIALRLNLIHNHLVTNNLQKRFCTVGSSNKASYESDNLLMQEFKKDIKSTGPMRMNEFMRQCLTHPEYGYYTCKKDVFGRTGDFVTSPEISCLFGEMLGIWCLFEWHSAGKPEHVQICELGPGTGKLANDILKVMSQTELKAKVNYFLHETSDILRLEQSNLLIGNDCKDIPKEKFFIDKNLKSKTGIDITWCKDIKDLRSNFTFFIANEFLDALPVDVYKKRNNVWTEEVVDLANNNSKLILTTRPLSDEDNVYMNQICEERNDKRSHIELTVDANKYIHDITRHIADHGGYALISDYGYDGNKSDTLKVIKNHKFVNRLMDCGTADISTDVDFSQIRHMTKFFKTGIHTCGPVCQGDFLSSMGVMKTRFEVLLRKLKTEEEKKKLRWGYEKLIRKGKGEMGEEFKMFVIMNDKVQGKGHLPFGFQPIIPDMY